MTSLHSATPKRKTQITKKPQKIENESPTLWPIFEDAADFTDDPFWKEVLLAASKGSFRKKNTAFDGECLKKIRKKNPISIEIPKDDPKRVARIFIEFHQKYDGRYSPKDIRLQVESQNNFSDEKVIIEWGTCSRKKREVLVTEYAKKISIENELDPIVQDKLSLTLRLLVTQKLLTPSDMEIENNEIQRLKCLHILPESKTFSLDKDMVENVEIMLSKSKTKSVKRKQENAGNISASWNVTIERKRNMVAK